MTYDRFEDLPVWKAAARLFVQVDRLCESEELRARGDVADQLHRATLSISNNIAEGFEEGSREQLITYLYHAKGSAGEVRSMLTVLCGTPRFQPLRGRLSEIRTLAEEVGRQLAGFLGSLQNSDLRGHRYLNDAVREQRERAARAAAFDERIKAIVKEARGSAEAAEARDGPAEG